MKPYGCFSNFYPAEFKDDDNVLYSSSEQYLMAQKALLMQDTESFIKIINTHNPVYCKRFGRKISPWNQKLWDEHKFNIMFKGLLHKFSQNTDMMNTLLSTDTAILAEASPRDRIWGIGLSVKDAKKGKYWRGENLLGKILMKVRDKLFEEYII